MSEMSGTTIHTPAGMQRVAVLPRELAATIRVVPARLPGRVALAVKRLMDIAGSATALFLLAPICVAITIAIRCESRGPAIYSSRRVGHTGRLFSFYKFRSMVVDAESRLEELRGRNERKGLLFKISDDPRVTRVGRFLRTYSLDEIPQFYNVLRGEMSLVGPRPPLLSEVEHYTLDCARRLEVKPGITGLWQVLSRRDPSWENYVALDLRYIDHWSLWLDVKILFLTIPAVFRGTGQ